MKDEKDEARGGDAPNAPPPGVGSSLSRRSVVAGAAGIAVLAAFGGAAKAFGGEDGVIYPPGSGDLSTFMGACIRCDRCRSACPTGAIGVGTVEDGLLNMRMPVMEFRKGYCDMCDGDCKCIKACPTGALGSFDPTADRIGVAVIDYDECELYGISGHCHAPCIDACKWDALSLDDNGRLVLDESLCNGCGACEYVCPTSAYGNYNSSGKRGINIEPLGGGRR